MLPTHFSQGLTWAKISSASEAYLFYPNFEFENGIILGAKQLKNTQKQPDQAVVSFDNCLRPLSVLQYPSPTFHLSLSCAKWRSFCSCVLRDVVFAIVLVISQYCAYGKLFSNGVYVLSIQSQLSCLPTFCFANIFYDTLHSYFSFHILSGKVIFQAHPKHQPLNGPCGILSLLADCVVSVNVSIAEATISRIQEDSSYLAFGAT